MKVLVLGGTGAMGGYLVQLLAEQGNAVTVTSRKSRRSNFKNVKYIQGNAHDDAFLKELLLQKYDSVVDYMIYNTEEFANRYRMLLDRLEGGQYVFFSSSRVYADSHLPIKESFPRLLDVIEDKEYLATDEYALAKAKQENMLTQSGQHNWTIIRPYITYSNTRLQLGAMEKEAWLQRAVSGKAIVFSKDIAVHRTTLTYGEDVSRVVIKLIGNKKAFGKAVHITGNESMLWSDVLEIYQNVLQSKLGIWPRVVLTENSDGLVNILNNKYQVKYDRLYNRVFDNSLVNSLCGEKIAYTTMEKGLSKCLEEFLNGQKLFSSYSSSFEGWSDRLSNENTDLRKFSGIKNKLRYIKHRYL